MAVLDGINCIAAVSRFENPTNVTNGGSRSSKLTLTVPGMLSIQVSTGLPSHWTGPRGNAGLALRSDSHPLNDERWNDSDSARPQGILCAQGSCTVLNPCVTNTPTIEMQPEESSECFGHEGLAEDGSTGYGPPCTRSIAFSRRKATPALA